MNQPTAKASWSSSQRSVTTSSKRHWGGSWLALNILILPTIVSIISFDGSVFVSVSAEQDDVHRCTTDDECKDLIPNYFTGGMDGTPRTLASEGSVCNKETGLCTNPFERGCLYNRLPGWTKKRVCNSDDPINAVELGLCDMPEFDYMEVRIGSGNWDTVFFNAWLLQILLSEMLGVPTTLEPGLPNTRINYYDTTGAIEIGMVMFSEAVVNADKYTDCRAVSEHNQEVMLPDDTGDVLAQYQPCHHVFPEVWPAYFEYGLSERVIEIVESPDELGVLARQGLFIPKITVERDPTLLSYIGMQGEENRQKLADRFLRPTSWRDYCAEVSEDNCATPTNITVRPPLDDEEGDMYFKADLYTGHFRKTDRNIGNETHPPTGHLIDSPCEWISFAEQQLFHLNIHLSGDRYGEGQRGYSISHYFEVLMAANATKSDFIMQFGIPDPYYQRLIGTDMEMYPVVLPPVTQTCLEHKRPQPDECSADFSTRVGDPLGACDDPHQSLQKIVTSSLRQSTYDPSISEAERSPALAALNLYRNSAPMYGTWFDLVNERDGLRPYRRAALRDATCQWVVDNFETFREFVPQTYPRVIQNGHTNLTLYASALVLAGVAIGLGVVASAVVYRYRRRRVIVVAQIEFLWLLLLGLLIMSIGSLVVAVSPTDGTCIASIWLVYGGYTVELVPLLTKVAAVNRLMEASRRFQKIMISRKSLFGTVMAVTSLVVIYLAIWTARDPPEKQSEFTLSTSETTNDETIVYRTYYCSSESDIWDYVAFAWTATLLFSATVLAVQMRNVRQEFNESQTLGIMTYSHFVFLILRLITFFLTDKLGASNSARYRSILLSVDAMATLVIYFLPKFIVLRNPDVQPPKDHFESSRNGRPEPNPPFASIDKSVGLASAESASARECSRGSSGGRGQYDGVVSDDSRRIVSEASRTLNASADSAEQEGGKDGNQTDENSADPAYDILDDPELLAVVDDDDHETPSSEMQQ